jgi:hypothetical protein
MDRPGADEIEEEVRAAVESFMAAFGPIEQQVPETPVLAKG